MTDDDSDDFDYDGHGLVQNLISDTEEDDGVGIGFSLDACRLGGYNDEYDHRDELSEGAYEHVMMRMASKEKANKKKMTVRMLAMVRSQRKERGRKNSRIVIKRVRKKNRIVMKRVRRVIWW